ncbi:MAG: DMT family transporter [Chloroflexi bacterium]|nr:DMT family transporter [Chloroflexota bacterium]
MTARRTPATATASPVRPALHLILAAACWGVGTVMSKQAVAVVPPLLLLPGQLAASLVFLIGLVIVRGERSAFTTRPRPIDVLGMLNPGLAYALALVALRSVSASVAVVVWATEPAIVAILARIVLGERLSAAQGLLSAVAVAGIIVLAGASGPGTEWQGVALLVAAVLCCAAYTVATRRWLPGVVETAGLVLRQQAAGLVFALALALLAGSFLDTGPRSGVGFDGLAIASVVGSGVVYYGLAYAFYLAALRHVTAPVAATSFYLVPVFGLWAAFAVGERLEVRAWVGAGLVIAALAGMVIASRPALRGRTVDG